MRLAFLACPGKWVAPDGASFDSHSKSVTHAVKKGFKAGGGQMFDREFWKQLENIGNMKGCAR